MAYYKCNCMFVPPRVLENLAKVGVRKARLSIQQSKISRKKRVDKQIDMKAFMGTKTKAKPKRKVYDCKNKWEQRVKLVRAEGKPATGDKDVDLVYKYAGNVRDYFNKVLKRNSIDNKGMDLILNVHFGEDYMNAFWDGDEMTFGDGDGEIFISFTESLDVVAHELAHVSRGDTYYITLVCSLANFFERLRDALEPEDEVPWGPEKAQLRMAPWLAYLGVTISSILMHLLSTLISRQREILADAAAVEFSRNPRALARGIYKAHLKNSFVGDFNLTYTPLFIVPPESKGEEDGWFDRLFNSHPPLMNRIELLTESARIKPSEVIEEVWEIQKNREKARTILASKEERYVNGSAAELPGEDVPARMEKIWSIRTSKGQWQGPYSLEELIFQPIFSPLIRVRNDPENVEAQAREFPHIRTALRNLGRKKPVDSTKHNRCPHCRISLHNGYYEGVEVKTCPRCRGKLVDFPMMERIIARKEVGFSENLIKKAEEFRTRFMESPILTKKIFTDKPPPISCPNCGSRMLLRPYSYHYVVPVDKCLSCYKIWFEADELEILQILIERR